MHRNNSGTALLIGAAALLLTGCYAKSNPLPGLSPDLTIYTCQDESVYEPIVKEFQERTGKIIQVKTGNFLELENLLLDDNFSQTCDVVFGVNAATLDQYQKYWQPYESPNISELNPEFYDSEFYWTGFTAIPPVILYNTKVVTYRELPAGWSSLLEPRWKGRIAFMDPSISDLHSTALVSAMSGTQDPQLYLEQLAENLNYTTYPNHASVRDAVSDGQCSLGVCLEIEAEELRIENMDIDYIYPKEGSLLIPEATAIVKNCAHPEAAAEFLDFTISHDTQLILVTHMKRRSVRGDFMLPVGLPAIKQLPLLSMEFEQIYTLRSQALEEWDRQMSSHAGGDGS